MNPSIPQSGIEPLESRIAPATFLVTSLLDAGPGTLRQAILDANALKGPDIIKFPNLHAPVITLTAPLPDITDSITIDGLSSQTGTVSLDGRKVVANGGASHISGLILKGPNSNWSTIRGLAIYGFDHAGIELIGTSFNTITQNVIGLTPSQGLTPKTMTHGILIDGGMGNSIGTGPTGNIIVGNGIGIRITANAQDTSIAGNKIGVGTNERIEARPNDIGIFVESATRTMIGRSTAGNIISGNETFGIELGPGASNTTILRNTIGLDASGSFSAGHQDWGIFVDNAYNTFIGEGRISEQNAGSGNVISGNSSGGIWMVGTSKGQGITVSGNRIGTNAAGTSVPNFPGSNYFIGNGGPGILLTLNSGATGTIRGNLISGNLGAALEVHDLTGSSALTVQANVIGANVSLSKPLGNGFGIIVDGLACQIGGGGELGNTIVASRGDGILVKNSNSAKIEGNNIGYSPISAANADFGNLGDGIHLSNIGTATIGGASINRIMSSGGDGIHIDGTRNQIVARFPNVTIQSNLIGNDGVNPLGNQGDGIHIEDISVGSVTAKGNTVQSNQGSGVLVERASNVKIEGNMIGDGDQEPSPLNRGDGIILIDATNAQIRDNDIRNSNGGVGVLLSNSLGTKITENRIYDGLHGIVLEHGTVESTIEGNHVSGSSRETVMIRDGSNNAIIDNSLFGNRGIAVLAGEHNEIRRNEFETTGSAVQIDLGGDGVTPNDPLDSDSGANGLLNSPILTSAILQGVLTVRGEYRGLPDTDVHLDWYVGGSFLASTALHTDANGFAPLTFVPDGNFALGTSFSASATVETNTSEFSNSLSATLPLLMEAKGIKPGRVARIQMHDALNNELVLDQPAFGKNYRGGLSIASSDVDHDGLDDLIVGKRTGAPVVRIFSGLDGHEIAYFGVGMTSNSIQSIAAGDLEHDGTIEVVVGQAKGGRIAVFDALSGRIESEFRPFGFNPPSGIRLSLDDIDGDARPEIIVNAVVYGTARHLILDPVSGHIERLARSITRGQS